MRVSDDRYTRDRQRLDLGLRLIHHEARTFTIHQWTGLSDDRIRKLYRSYVMHHDARRVLRHRGKSPRQAAFFFKSTELNFQSAQPMRRGRDFPLHGVRGSEIARLAGQAQIGLRTLRTLRTLRVRVR